MPRSNHPDTAPAYKRQYFGNICADNSKLHSTELCVEISYRNYREYQS